MDTPGFLRESSETPCEWQVELMVLRQDLRLLDSQVPNPIPRKVWLKVKHLQHEKMLRKHCDPISHTTNTLNVHLKIFSPNPSPRLAAFDSPTYVSHSNGYTSDSALNNASDLSTSKEVLQRRQARVEGSVIMDAPTNGRQDCATDPFLAPCE